MCLNPGFSSALGPAEVLKFGPLALGTWTGAPGLKERSAEGRKLGCGVGGAIGKGTPAHPQGRASCPHGPLGYRCAAVFMSLQGHRIPPPTGVPAPEEPAASGDGLLRQPEPRVPQVRPVPGAPRPPSRPPQGGAQKEGTQKSMGRRHLRARQQVSAGTGKAALSPGVPPPQLPSSPPRNRNPPSVPREAATPGVPIHLGRALSIFLSSPSCFPKSGLPLRPPLGILENTNSKGPGDNGVCEPGALGAVAQSRCSLFSHL